MRFATEILVVCFLLLGFFVADYSWKYILPTFQDTVEPYKPVYISQDAVVPWSTCTDCQYATRRRQRTSLPEWKELVTLEFVNDFIIIISCFLISTAWVALFSVVLNHRVQRNIDDRFNAMFVANVDPDMSFEDSRKRG